MVNDILLGGENVLSGYVTVDSEIIISIKKNQSEKRKIYIYPEDVELCKRVLIADCSQVSAIKGMTMFPLQLTPHEKDTLNIASYCLLIPTRNRLFYVITSEWEEGYCTGIDHTILFRKIRAV